MSQSPYGEFGNVTLLHNKKRKGCTLLSQSPYGEFGNVTISVKFEGFENEMSQSPYGEFGNVTLSPSTCSGSGPTGDFFKPPAFFAFFKDPGEK